MENLRGWNEGNQREEKTRSRGYPPRLVLLLPNHRKLLQGRHSVDQDVKEVRYDKCSEWRGTAGRHLPDGFVLSAALIRRWCVFPPFLFHQPRWFRELRHHLEPRVDQVPVLLPRSRAVGRRHEENDQGPEEEKAEKAEKAGNCRIR